MSCNCENTHCKQGHMKKLDFAPFQGALEWAPCHNETQGHKAPYVGDLCPGCWNDMPEQYRYPYPCPKYLRKGDRVSVRAHKSIPGKGLTYSAFTGTLLDDPGVSEGWDVVDMLNEQGEEVSVYCFSIIREEIK